MINAASGGETPSEVHGGAPGRGGLVFLGAILILVFFHPLVEGRYPTISGYDRSVTYKVKFVNIEILLSDEHIPAMTRFITVYPLIAGIVILIAAVKAPRRVLNFILIGLGIILYLARLIGEYELQTINWLPPGNGVGKFIDFLGEIGLTGLLAGSLARRHRPKSNIAAIMGIVGGVLFLGSLLLPIFFTDIRATRFALPFHLYGAKNGRVAAMTLFMILSMLSWIVACILCFANTPRRGTDSAKAMSIRAFKYFWIGAVLAFLTALFFMCGGITEASQFGIKMLGVSKNSFWVVGTFLMLPLGLAGLTVMLPNMPVGAAKVVPSAQSSEDRLHEIQRLHEQGLITQEEYEDLRSEIISSLRK